MTTSDEPTPRGPLTEEEVEESIRFADGVLAAAGHVVDRSAVRDDTRAALRGEITFEEAVDRARQRALRAAEAPDGEDTDEQV